MKTLEWNAERRVPREFNRLAKIYAKGRECENPRQWARFVKQVRGGTSGPSDKKTEEILWTCLKKTFRDRPTACRTNFYGIAQDILLFANMDKVRIDKFSWTYHPHRNIEITRKFNHTQGAIVSRKTDYYMYTPQNMGAHYYDESTANNGVNSTFSLICDDTRPFTEMFDCNFVPNRNMINVFPH